MHTRMIKYRLSCGREALRVMHVLHVDQIPALCIMVFRTGRLQLVHYLPFDQACMLYEITYDFYKNVNIINNEIAMRWQNINKKYIS